MPDGSAGIALGQVGITATDLSLDKVPGTKPEDTEKTWFTRGSKGGFNGQLLVTNTSAALAMDVFLDQSTGDIGAGVTANQFGFDDNASLPANRMPLVPSQIPVWPTSPPRSSSASRIKTLPWKPT